MQILAPDALRLRQAPIADCARYDRLRQVPIADCARYDRLRRVDRYSALGLMAQLKLFGMKRLSKRTCHHRQIAAR